MKRGLAAGIGVIALALAAAAPAVAGSGERRYALANGCYALKDPGTGRLVAREGSRFRASAASPAEAEAFRLKATDLGSYLLYTKDRRFLAAASGTATIAEDASEATDWDFSDQGARAFTLRSFTNRSLGTDPSGRLVASPSGGSSFEAEPAQGCAEYPEVEVNASGEPRRGETPYEEVRGLLDSHLHLGAYEFLGGSLHCGRPWHRFGAPFALQDCPDHQPNGAGAVVDNALIGSPVRTHDPTGWPTFRDWPAPNSLTHEQTYYKWVERAWRGGLRIIVNDLVENEVLCRIYPLKRNSCDEMESARLQARRMRELQDYIDAQNGGPGRGWFRLVRDPFEARRVINEGKVAVILGMETSKLFGCDIYADVPACDRASIDRQLEDFYALGVRSMFPVHKFDNALGGTRFDSGAIGVVVNSGNREQTGSFWQIQTCTGPESDNEQIAPPGGAIAAGLAALLPPGAAPVYPPPPHCNKRGLTRLGEYLVRRMIAKKMIVEPDHMSALARRQTLDVLAASGYSGLIASHSWSDPESFPRYLELGGVITPYAGDSENFADEWRRLRSIRIPGRYFGTGFGADSNGLGNQGSPRGGENPVTYPFRSFDGSVTIDKQRSGERVFDVNTDGVAHYGLYPDWVEDLRKIAGDQIIEDMSRGAEAYLQMWERAEGIRGPACRPRHERARGNRLSRISLGASPVRTLRSAGQPQSRRGRVWRWCVAGRANRRARVVAAFEPAGRVVLAGTTARGHAAAGVGPGRLASALRRISRPAGRGLRVRRLRGSSFVYGIRGRRVSFVAVASSRIASSPRRLRSYLRLAGLR